MIRTYSNRPHSTEGVVRPVCGICASGRRRAYWNCGEYRYVRCNNCGHVYQYPQPDSAALQARYAEHYFEYERENDTRFLNLMLLGLGDVKMERRISRVRRSGLSLLDVGCATGALLEYYHKRGWRVQGVEICQEAAEWGRAARGVPIYSGALHDARCAADSFHLVHASHLIEHLSDPGAFLKECRRVVAPEGYVVIVTPDRGGLQARLLGADWRSAIADHLHLFDFQRLKRLALQSGLRVVAKRSWGGLAQDVAPPWLRWLKRVADWAAKRLNIGDVMIVVLRREQ